MDASWVPVSLLTLQWQETLPLKSGGQRMEIHQARFLFEVQRVGDRMAAECRFTPDSARLISASRTPSVVRHAMAIWLHRLADRVDVFEVRPA